MNGNTIRTFLGANSSEGFSSLYGAFSEENRTVIIKGGPGSGKSGILKRIASEAVKNGYFTEYCYCSSDAESLDAVRIPEKNLCIMDGTPPHTAEPRFPGALDEILYTGQFWNSDKLRSSLPEIRDLSERIRNCFSGAYRYLSAAGKAATDVRTASGESTDREKMKKFAVELIRRQIGKTTKKGRILPRFLSGITPQGLIVNRDTVYTLADKVYVLEDPYRVSEVFLDTVIETAEEYSQTVYVFYDPLCPSVAEHVILPDAGIGFVTANRMHAFEPQNAYKIHLTRFTDVSRQLKERCRIAERLIAACLQEALNFLKQEKAYHDDLEEFYVEAMDFKKMNAFVSKYVKTLF